MKVVFTGGGTGGHFYPIIAVATAINEMVTDKRLITPTMYYFGNEKYDEKELYNANLKYVYCPSGKQRRGGGISSLLKNMVAVFIVLAGVILAYIKLRGISPDVVFSKGGYIAFPVCMAAKLLGIPVIMHESDASFGRVSKYTAKFAKLIGIAYKEAEKELTPEQLKRTARIGIPIRDALKKNPIPRKEAAKLFGLDPELPIILVLGGSMGSLYINDLVLDVLGKMAAKYQVIHQIGKKNIVSVSRIVDSVYRNDFNIRTRYKKITFFDSYYLRAAYSIADLCISRSGSGTISELAEWNIPSILIPIRADISHDQTKNAYAYARESGAIVAEQQNLSKNVFFSLVESVLENETKKKSMIEGTNNFKFDTPERKIAEAIIEILIEHEK